MKRRTILTAAVPSLLVVTTVAFAATRIRSRDGDARGERNRETAATLPIRSGDPKERPMVVKTTVAEPTTLTATVVANGSTAAIREVTFSSEIPGKIQALMAKLGDRVRKGQVLALIDRDTLSAEQDRAQASFDLAKATHDRLSALGEGIVSRQQLDESRSAMDTARAGLTIAENNAKKGVVRSSLNGIVTAKLKEKAEYTNPGEPIYRIVDHRTIVVEAQLAESTVAAVSKGAAVAVRIDALNETFTGQVQAVLPVADSASKTFTVRVEIDNPKLRILVGMSARLMIDVGTRKDVIVVPQDTVIEEQDSRSIFVARGNTAVKLPVRLGETYRDQVVVESGLRPGDHIITLGHRRLEDGQAIEVAL